MTAYLFISISNGHSRSLKECNGYDEISEICAFGSLDQTAVYHAWCMKAERDLNIDLLRILSILSIIAFHYVYHGNVGIGSADIYVSFAAEIVYHFGELGASCFILISGYYLERTSFKPRKVILFALEIEFYVLISKIILWAFGRPFDWKVSDFFPLFTGEYWFIHVYLLIYCLQPFLKKTLPVLDQKQLQMLIVSQILIWSVIPTVAYSSIFHGSTESMPYYNRYIWFLNVYIIGYYLQKYPIPIPKNDFIHLAEAKKWMVLILPFELLILFIITGEGGLWPFSATFFWPPNSFLMLWMSVAVFIAFRDWKPIKYRKNMEIAASTTLGIYLFHDGELRTFLWRVLFQIDDNVNLLVFMGWLILVTGIVFIVGMIIDLGRQCIEKNILIPAVSAMQQRVKGRGKTI